MTPIVFVSYVVWALSGLLSVALAVMSVWAFIDAVRASDYSYQSAFKRSKTFWVAVTAACALYSLFALSVAVNFGSPSLFMQLFAMVAAGVFLADVRPAVRVRR